MEVANAGARLIVSPTGKLVVAMPARPRHHRGFWAQVAGGAPLTILTILVGVALIPGAVAGRRSQPLRR